MALFERLLPRHLQIIYEINHRFLRQVQHALAGRHGAHARACRSSRRARAQAGAHGAPGDRRLAQRQRRGRAAHRAGQDASCCPTSTSCGPSASTTRPTASRRGAGCCTPTRASRACSSAHRLELDRSHDLRALRALGRVRRRRATSWTRCTRVKQANKRDARRRWSSARTGVELPPDAMFVVAGQAHPRVQAPAAGLPADRRALPGAQARSRAPTSCRAPTSSPARPRPATRWPSCTSSCSTTSRR